MTISLTNADLPAPELSMETFDAIHDTLLACALDKETSQGIRERCLELLLAGADSLFPLPLL